MQMDFKSLLKHGLLDLLFNKPTIFRLQETHLKHNYHTESMNIKGCYEHNLLILTKEYVA